MRILLFGRDGQLGRELNKSLASLGEIVAVEKEDLDLAQIDRIPFFIERIRPNVIINAAAYTNVDQAEIEPDTAYAINATAIGVMAESARKIGSFFIHYSTDYVFDGEKEVPYSEDDPPAPINAYGFTKLAGEQSIQALHGAYLILRTSWLYSIGRDSFPDKVLKWARKQKSMRIVEDQVGSPTWSYMLAEMTTELLGGESPKGMEWLAERSGLYHVAGNGAVSRFEWARQILELDTHPEEQIVERLDPARTEEFPTPAKRPRFSALDCHRFEEVFGLTLPGWKTSLKDAMAENI
jgi:dTDP-4-dehydrorhamnose reductase